ncbi:hypothetical protein TSAR_008020, partial [Trichomalopsis sarcophagae]
YGTLYLDHVIDLDSSITHLNIIAPRSTVRTDSISSHPRPHLWPILIQINFLAPVISDPEHSESFCSDNVVSVQKHNLKFKQTISIPKCITHNSLCGQLHGPITFRLRKPTSQSYYTGEKNKDTVLSIRDI